VLDYSCHWHGWISQKWLKLELWNIHWQYWSIFIRVDIVVSQICEITGNSPKIRTYSRSWSSKVIDLDANRKYICHSLLVINSNVGHISYSFWEIDCFPTWYFVWCPAPGNSSEFLHETNPVKNRGMGLLYIENCMILTSTIVCCTHVTDRWTDGWVLTHCTLYIYAVMR